MWIFNNRVTRLSTRLRDDADVVRCLRNAVYSSADSLLIPVLWFIATPFLVSRLGKELYGIWMLVYGLFGFGGILSFGLTDATVKFVSTYRAREDHAGIARVLQSSFTVYLALGGVAGLIVFALSSVFAEHCFNIAVRHRPAAAAAFRLAGLGLLVRFAYSIFQSAIHGFERHDLAARVGMGVNAVTMCLNLGLVLAGYRLRAVVLGTISVMAIGTIVQAMLLKSRLLPELRFKPLIDRTALKELVGYGTYTWLQAIVGAVGQNLDSFLLASFLSPTAVTYYSVSRRLAMQVHSVLARMSMFLFPFSGALLESGQLGRLRRLYEESTFWIIVLASGMIVPIFLLGGVVLHHWMGPEFAFVATPLLQVLCIRYALLPMGIVNYHYLLGAGMVRFLAALAVVNVSLSVGALLVLIPMYGPIGAALAQLFALPTMLFTRFYVVRRLFKDAKSWQTFVYFLPVVVPFGLAYLLSRAGWPPVFDVPKLVLWLGVVAVIAAGAAAGTGHLCREIGWLSTGHEAENGDHGR